MTQCLHGHRAFVVGGNGFIGRHVVKALLSAGAEVKIMDISPGPKEFCELDQVIGLVDDAALLSSAVSGFDAVIFLANNSLPGSANADLSSEVDAHVRVSVKAAEICNAQGVKRFIFASSGGTVYGYSSQEPLREDMPTRPSNAYGVSKLSIEHYLQIVHAQRDMDTVSLRISNPYGEGQRALRGQGFVAAAMQHAMNGMAMPIWGDGSVERDFIHVEDVARAFVAACKAENPPNVMNIGAGSATSLLDVLAQVEASLGRRVPIKFEPGRTIDVSRNVLDCSLAAKSLDWRPQVSLEDGIHRTADWWRQM